MRLFDIFGILRATKKGRGAIRPLTLSKFWHRRMCEAALFVAVAVIFVYFYEFLFGELTSTISVDLSALLIATVACFVTAAAYLWVPNRHIIFSTLLVYAAQLALIGYLIYGSGGASSPFIGLWIIMGVFSALFGIGGVVLFAVASSLYLFLGIESGALEEYVIITTILAGYIPAIVGFIILHQDIHQRNLETHKRKAGQKLSSELDDVASKSEVVINAIADGVIALDSKANIQLINPAAQQIIGWGKKDATNLNYKSVLKLSNSKDEPLEDAIDPILQTLNTNQETETSDLTITTQSGKKLLSNIIVSPVGQPGAGVIIVFRDITKEKHEEREQAEFISTASHEMRTPVASIEGYLGLVLNPATAQIDEKAREFILKAHESAQHLGRLFQDLLDVSKADDGRLNNNPKVVDVNAYVTDIAEGLRPQAEAKGLRFTVKTTNDGDDGGIKSMQPVYYAEVDNDHLREVTSNLIENAIKYTLSGDVIVDVTGDQDRVRVEVSDSGIGIAEEDIPHLFQKFYRIDNTDTREIGGTGLGLYLCRRLAEVMTGRIEVKSTMGKGSTFTLEIPRIEHQDAMRKIEERSNPPAIQKTQETLPTQPQQQVDMPAQEQPVAPAPPVPQPEQPTPAPAPPVQPAAPAVPPMQSPQPNATLSQIEQNPAAYTAAGEPRRGAVSIPVRKDSQ